MKTASRKPLVRKVVFSPRLLAKLLPYAERRNVSVQEIARRLIEASVDSDIVDAVLDDGK